ncbi:MAG: tyrosine-protein phosphatase [Candidatus Sumerlaeia bacterium]|nr:tyrosine-protein phosphatase [Candidatus Sumerlaeia bacterium]
MNTEIGRLRTYPTTPATKRFPFVRWAIAAVVLANASPTAAQTFDRWLRLDGAVNFRDIGGYDVTPTTMVALGRVYRSAMLTSLTATDADKLRSRGIRHILDLRTPNEVNAEPDSPLLDAFTTHTYIPVGFFSTTSHVIRYQHLIRDNSRQWRQALSLLANRNNLPLNLHCRAGRDRAGVLTALTLKTLGVPRETIIQDYLLSNQAYGTTVVYRISIETALNEIDTAGGIEDYLTSIGITADQRRAIRNNLLIRRPAAEADRRWQLYP